MRRKNTKETDTEDIDEYLKNTYQSKRKIVSDKLFGMLNYISLIPTLVYNIGWLYLFKNHLLIFGEEDSSACPEIFNWVNYIVTWLIINALKALFLLFCVQACVGDEFECKVICVIVKMLTSLIPAIIFVIKLPDYLYGDFKNKHCHQLVNDLHTFYKWEYAYVLFILCLFCLVPFGAIGMGIKEYLKSRTDKEC